MAANPGRRLYGYQRRKTPVTGGADLIGSSTIDLLLRKHPASSGYHHRFAHQLRPPVAISYALKLFRTDSTIGAVYFSGRHTSDLSHALIDKTNLDGFNGIFEYLCNRPHVIVERATISS